MKRKKIKNLWKRDYRNIKKEKAPLNYKKEREMGKKKQHGNIKKECSLLAPNYGNPLMV